MLAVNEGRAEFWKQVLVPIPDTSPLVLEEAGLDDLPRASRVEPDKIAFLNMQVIEVMPVPPGAVRREPWQSRLDPGRVVEGWREALDEEESFGNWQDALALILLAAFVTGLFVFAQGGSDLVALSWLSEIGR